MSDEGKNNNSRLFKFINSIAKDGIIDIRVTRNGAKNGRTKDIDRDG